MKKLGKRKKEDDKFWGKKTEKKHNIYFNRKGTAFPMKLKLQG